MPVRTQPGITARLELDTDDLMALFGIPESSTLRLEKIYFFATGVATLDITYDREDTAESPSTNEHNQNMITLSVGVASTMYEIDFGDRKEPIINKIIMTPSAETWTLIFIYDKSTEGEMDLSQEQVEVLDDINQLGGQMGDASEGSEFYQVGDRHKVDS